MQIIRINITQWLRRRLVCFKQKEKMEGKSNKLDKISLVTLRKRCCGKGV